MEQSAYNVHSLYIYPLKSAKGIQVTQAEAFPEGFKHDREWMVIDSKGKFMSQRLHPKMGSIKTAITPEGVTLSAPDLPEIIIPFEAEGEVKEGIIWDDKCQVQEVSRGHSDWISTFMGEKCSIVRMKKGEIRLVDPRYKVTDQDNTLFVDGFPLPLCCDSLSERPLDANRDGARYDPIQAQYRD
ncbi:MOSC N-terminal beta barrel domain-containing protein [Estrella lausannensis]|uniref:Molybdenum cofactor sulfurase sulfurase n=1 Tax=Estrella lausannensis TaxID=483423 RepID=A0A0H5DPE7_9BACT|nr:MOSC domain-containing protein [Estrella lausannensis]CRX38302.1 Molybdenum cofactor sulfurase sulfurase [Estrella lausannensis]